MPSAPSPIPPGFNTVSVYLVVPKAAEALGFYEKAFGAETISRMPGPDGESTMHAEMRIGNSIVMLTDENPTWNLKSPVSLGGSAASLHLYVEDVDAAFDKAVAAGCTAEMPLSDMFWGDRYGKVKDPYGHVWGMASRKESLTAEEVQERQKQFMASLGAHEACG